MSSGSRPVPVRALGRWDLTALVVNGILGSGIFGLPAAIAALVGWLSPLAYLLAGAGIACIVLCFAEVSARFTVAGGPYVYARRAFGRFVGVQVGWVSWLVRMASAGANANLLVLYLASFWPQAQHGLARVAVLTALFGLLTVVNYRGVRQGALASNLLVIGKLIPLLIFTLVGLFACNLGTLRSWVIPQPNWTRALLLLIFAYGGFENATFPGAEMRNARRDAPFALLAGLGLVSGLYFAIQIIFLATVPAGTHTDQPLATAALHFLGPAGVWMISAGALIYVWGWFAGTMLGTPRLTYALAEQGDFPAVFARLHARFRTPHVSILVFSLLSWMLALAGTFEWNASLSAVARLLTYGTTCAALLPLRHRMGAEGDFRLPAGLLWSFAGVAFCASLLFRMSRTELTILAATVVLASFTWLWARSQDPGRAPVN